MEEEPKQTKNQKPQKPSQPNYRELEEAEIDLLFALYDKHNGNRNAIIRDHDSQFHSYAQVSHYCKIYDFQSRLVEVRRKRAEETIAQLGDYKIEAIQRAAELVSPRQVPLKFKHPTSGEMIIVRDADDNVVYETMWPSDREIKTAWEIIKTELGEPTKHTDITSKGEAISGNAITFANFKDEDQSESQ